MLLIVQGKASLPTDADGWRVLGNANVDSAENGKFLNVLPGEYTVFVVRGEEEPAQEGFSQIIHVSDQATQTVTLTPSAGWKRVSWAAE